ncbi:WASH complex subunit 3 [Holothuria leucospilota]|uniref:WASH complex subunit 3 n=1 Tax=Holothuria leucospilota TaxID=206669 RepID=A0A9Q1BSF7_HOLLE|nr:WASH complex subunit 3 [Holothuria leucospilota]
MLAFLNHFIIHTTRFLNKFSCVCEQKLLDLNQRIQKLEVTMNILEAKVLYTVSFVLFHHLRATVASIINPSVVASVLGYMGILLASIPGLENVTVEQTSASQGAESNLPQVTAGEGQEQKPSEEEAAPEAPPTMTVSQDPRYMKYFKMINMGVPIEPLRNKVLMDGLDPDLLLTPDAPAPPMTQEDSSESSFGSEESGNESSD